jgi:hypothetical protein
MSLVRWDELSPARRAEINTSCLACCGISADDLHAMVRGMGGNPDAQLFEAKAYNPDDPASAPWADAKIIGTIVAIVAVIFALAADGCFHIAGDVGRMVSNVLGWFAR